MEVLHPRCAGLDVHKDIIVACRRRIDGRSVQQDVQSFDATTGGLLDLAAWIGEWEIAEVVMESTGVYWIPVWNVLEEEGFKLTLVNPQHVKNVPGRKSDVKDAEWLAKLLAHGMVRASFIPPAPQRELRNLVRTLRHFVQDRTQQVQRMQKVLQGCRGMQVHTQRRHGERRRDCGLDLGGASHARTDAGDRKEKLQRVSKGGLSVEDPVDLRLEPADLVLQVLEHIQV